MKEPKRLLSQDPSESLRRLLTAGAEERPSSSHRNRVRHALGLTTPSVAERSASVEFRAPRAAGVLLLAALCVLCLYAVAVALGSAAPLPALREAALGLRSLTLLHPNGS